MKHSGRKVTLKPEPEPVVETPQPEPEPEPVRQQAVATPSKSDAIRKAIEAGQSKPTEGVAWIKQQFGLDVTPGMFSTVKQQHTKKGNTHVVRAPNPAHRPAVSRFTPSRTSSSSSGIHLARQVRDLIQEHGSDAVREAVELFAD